MGFIIKIILYIVMIFISVFFFSLIFNLLKKLENTAEKSIDKIDERYKKKGQMGKEKKRLSKLGIMYRFGDYNMNPSKYEILRLFIGLLVTAVLFLLDIGLGVFSLLGLPVGYFATDYVFKKLNASDNESMSMDIYNTYANLKIQLTAGVYLGDCLEYTYKIVQNKRYKEALREFILNFSDKTLTSTETIEIFRNRFQSKEIDKLCSMMEMFVQYGVSENYLQDIMTEIQSILSADSIRAENGIEQKTGFVIFGFFTMVIILVVIAMAQTFNGITLF